MNWAYLYDAIIHVPLTLVVVGLVSVLLGQFTGKRGVWLYGTVSVALAAVSMLVAWLVAAPISRASATSGVVPLPLPSYLSAGLLATLMMAMAGLASAVAWRRLVRYPRELVMPGWLRAAVLISAIAGTLTVVYATLVR